MGIVLGVWVGLSIFAFYFVALPIGYLFGCFFVGDWGQDFYIRMSLQRVADYFQSLSL